MSKISKFFKGSSSSSSSSGGKSKHRSKGGPSPQEAIHKLRETEDMLTKKQDYLEKRIEQEVLLAKKHGTRNKRAALQALKRKKRLEQQLTQIDGTLSTIEFQREALENSHTNTEVVKNMGYAAQAMKKVHESMDLNKIDELMDDINEQQDVAREINEAISRPTGETYDEDELLAELEELEKEDMDENLRSMGGLPSVPSARLPSVPSGRASHRATARRRAEDEDDMRMLASWGI
ncbi:charged multivesicular body protein 4c [Corythoichthys intestinalis]|uniref:charged multivesicular body protein 4c n=1 Tax=Corythoichthys intestinalis TaxID=161448 RepID=UPI0025A6235C|nr:charged multivesicular body protein 4c [Corythoichthys intestinalis]XP_061809947.1 charged multivesicular body protein 4c-like [Nerophis lumbriciformis]